METIAEYHIKNNLIEELTKKNTLLMKNNWKWKSKYKKLAETLDVKVEQNRGEKALDVIKDLKGTGRASVLIRQVAKKCHLSESRVKALWYKK